MTPETYKESMPADTDWPMLVYELRRKLMALCAAANVTVMDWDGHHRLALAVADAYTAIANERLHCTAFPRHVLD